MKRVLARFVAVVAALAVAVTVPGAAAEPADDAAAVRQSQEALTNAAAAGDIAATDTALAELTTLLTGWSRDLVTPALDETATARDQLAAQFPDEARTLGVPTVPAALNQLLQKLLATLSELSENLLGNGIPLPA